MRSDDDKNGLKSPSSMPAIFNNLSPLCIVIFYRSLGGIISHPAAFEGLWAKAGLAIATLGELPIPASTFLPSSDEPVSL